MPNCSGHPVCDRLVDRVWDEPVVQPLPHVDWALDACHVECPTAVEKFGVAYQSAGAMCEAFGAGVSEGGFNQRLTQNLLIVVIGYFSHLIDVTSGNV